MQKRNCKIDGAPLRIFWDEPMGTAWQCTQCLVVKDQRELDADIANVLHKADKGATHDL